MGDPSLDDPAGTALVRHLATHTPAEADRQSTEWVEADVDAILDDLLGPARRHRSTEPPTVDVPSPTPQPGTSAVPAPGSATDTRAATRADTRAGAPRTGVGRDDPSTPTGRDHTDDASPRPHEAPSPAEDVPDVRRSSATPGPEATPRAGAERRTRPGSTSPGQGSARGDSPTPSGVDRESGRKASGPATDDRATVSGAEARPVPAGTTAPDRAHPRGDVAAFPLEKTPPRNRTESAAQRRSEQPRTPSTSSGTGVTPPTRRGHDPGRSSAPPNAPTPRTPSRPSSPATPDAEAPTAPPPSGPRPSSADRPSGAPTPPPSPAPTSTQPPAPTRTPNTTPSGATATPTRVHPRPDRPTSTHVAGPEHAAPARTAPLPQPTGELARTVSAYPERPVGQGVTWTSGVHLDERSAANPRRVRQLEHRHGRPADVVVAPARVRSLSELAGSASVPPGLAGSTARAVLPVPMLPAGASLTACAKGEYRAHWAGFARQLRHARLTSPIVDLTPPTPVERSAATTYTRCYRDIARTVRGVAPGVRFQWTVDRGPAAPGAADPVALWPGRDMVDVVAVRALDSGSWGATVNGEYGLNWWADFAHRQGRRIAVAEWGTRPGSTRSAENAAYVQNMRDWIARIADKGSLAYEASHFPGSRGAATEAYLRLFGA